MAELAFQDYYPDNRSYCYGCGRLNEQGLQIKSRWKAFFAVRLALEADLGCAVYDLLPGVVENTFRFNARFGSALH